MATLDPEKLAREGRLAAARGDLPRAIELLSASLDLHPDPRLAFFVGNLLFESRRFIEATERFRQTVSAMPHAEGAIRNLASSLLHAGRPRESHQVALDGFRRNADRDTLSVGLLAGNYLPEIDEVEAFEQHLAYRTGLPADPGAQKLPNDRDPDRPLRVAFVSGDLRTHPVGFLLDALLPAIDPGQFEILVLSTAPAGDALNVRLRSGCRSWHEISKASDAEVRSLACSLGVDVAFDMSGHTGGGRLPLFASRIAPVQISWYGYANTSAVPAMDYLLADPREVPDGAERFLVEQPMRLPESYICHAPPADEDPEPTLRSSDPFTFGSFNNVAKLTDEVLRTWSSILAEVPDSRLIMRSTHLADPVAHRAMLDRLRGAGFDPRRCDVGCARGPAATLQAYRSIDLALDPWPYTGCTTTLDAIWMGVPVLTRVGRGIPGRHSSSHLHAVGQQEWVAGDEQDYARRAIEAAGRRDALRRGRRERRDRAQESVLLQPHRFAVQWSAALREAWRRWCRGASPSPLSI